MTKRKGPQEKAFNEPTGRKWVAFSAPKDAATKALIKQNGFNSPLLRLPLEIRNKIWSEVLGDRLIHFRYHGSAWRHMVCETDCTETPKIKNLATSEGEVISMQSHDACEFNLIHILEWCYFGHEMMRLGVLRSCRQIYVEANNILWTTNTFSFADATTFRRFIMTRTINQKRLIKILRLRMFSFEEKKWNKALNMALVRSLSALRRLRLYIEYDVYWGDYEYAKSQNLLYGTSHFSGLKKLSTLPLNDVNIVVQHSRHMSIDHGWSEVERQEFAEGLRKILLNPKGASIYAEDQLK